MKMWKMKKEMLDSMGEKGSPCIHQRLHDGRIEDVEGNELGFRLRMRLQR